MTCLHQLILTVCSYSWAILRFTSIAMMSWFVTSVKAVDSVTDMFLEGHFSGQIRSYYIDRNYTGVDAKRNGTAIGGYLRYETGIWHGLNLGAAVYTTNRILQGLEYDIVDPSIFEAFALCHFSRKPLQHIVADPPDATTCMVYYLQRKCLSWRLLRCAVFFWNSNRAFSKIPVRGGADQAGG